MFAVDGCKIASNCAKEWSGTKKELKKKAQKIEAAVRLLVERHRASDSQPLEPGQEQKEQRAVEHLQSKATKSAAGSKTTRRGLAVAASQSRATSLTPTVPKWSSVTE
jgi:hypothetical protein